MAYMFFLIEIHNQHKSDAAMGCNNGMINPRKPDHTGFVTYSLSH